MECTGSILAHLHPAVGVPSRSLTIPSEQSSVIVALLKIVLIKVIYLELGTEWPLSGAHSVKITGCRGEFQFLRESSLAGTPRHLCREHCPAASGCLTQSQTEERTKS